MKMEGGYHGSHDWVSVATAPPYEVKATSGLSPGALAEVLLGCYNDVDYTAELIRKHRHELAAVIVEPMMGASGAIVAAREFLHTLREVTAECGVLLIVDEIITFRLALGGLQEHFGVRPDLTTFGKIIGGGLPIGAFGGRVDVMTSCDRGRPVRGSGGMCTAGVPRNTVRWREIPKAYGRRHWCNSRRNAVISPNSASATTPVSCSPAARARRMSVI